MEDQTPINSTRSPLRYAVLFRQDATGRTVFYPYGALSKGYCVPDRSTQVVIGNHLMLHLAIWLIVISICIFIGQDKPIAILFLIMFILLSGMWYRIRIRSLVRGLKVVGIGDESYSPPSIDRRYRGLFMVIILGGMFGGMGDIYNKGFSIADLLLVVGSPVILVLWGYITWLRN